MTTTDILNVVVVVCTCLSMIGSCFVMISYLKFSDLRSPSFTFALWLALAGIGFSSTSFLPSFGGADSVACKIYPAVEIYFNLAAALTTAVVARSIRMIFSQQSTQVSIEIWHVMVVWVLPIGLVMLPYSTNSYGQNESDIYCFIKTDYDQQWRNNLGQLWTLLVFYGPVLCIIIYNGQTYWRVIIRARLLWVENPTLAEKIKSIVNRIKLYPIILAVIYVIPLSHRLAEEARHDHTWLDQMAYSSLKLQGFLDSLAYGINSNLIERWKAELFPAQSDPHNPSDRKTNLHNKADISANVIAETTTNDLHNRSRLPAYHGRGAAISSAPSSGSSSIMEMQSSDRGSSLFPYSIDDDNNIFS